MSTSHAYILDTCVLIHDPNSIYSFGENDIIIPLACIDDLDAQKTQPGSLGAAARAVFRILKRYALDDLLEEGTPINEEGGRLFIYNPLKGNLDTSIIPEIIRENSDNAIITTCLQLKQQYPGRKIAVVTKDIGLQIRCRAYGCIAEDYRTDFVRDEFHSGIRDITINSTETWSSLWKQTELPIGDFPEEIASQLKDLSPNEFILFHYGESLCPGIHKKGIIYILKDKHNEKKPSYFGISGNNIEQNMALNVLNDDNTHLVILNGRAGTGKTLMSLAVALEKLENFIYDRIIIIKPIIPVSGRDIGALPGSKWEKLSEWLGPIRDNFEQLVQKRKEQQEPLNGKRIKENIEDMIADGSIEAEAMTYIQGRSIPRSFILVDETQNLTPREARMIVERCGKGSKVVFCGDLSQIEHPYLDARSCGLAHACNGSRGVENCATITLKKVERSELAAIASEIFKSPEAQH